MSEPLQIDDTLSAILSTALDAAIAMDEAGAIVGWNPVAERTFGWSAREVRGMLVGDVVVPPEVRAAHSCGVQRYIRTGEPVLLGKHIEVEAIRRNGQRFPIELSTTEVKIGGRRLFLGFIRDISDRKKNEREIAEVTERLSLAVKVHSIGVFDTDVETGRVQWNAELAAIYGYKFGSIDMTTDAWRAHVLPSDFPRVDKAFKSAIAAKSSVISYKYRIRRCDGVIRSLEASARLFYDAAGNHVRRVGVNIDVTQRETMERELLQSRADLAHLSRLNSLGAMASSLGHELNQPLTAVVNYLGAAQILVQRTSGLSEPIVQAIENASASAMRAGDIIRRLRSMALKRPIQSRAVNLTEVISETVPLALLGTDLTGIEITLDVHPEANGVFSDPTLLQLVFFNLMRNAVEAMSTTGGHITVRAMVNHSQQVLVELADSGPGLPPEMQQNLFTAFKTTKSEGMGVGLSVCRTIVESLGGRIWATSGPEGTTFSFTITRMRATVPDVRQAKLEVR